MKLIKYWRVQLFKAENRGMAPGNAEVLIFEGYSKDKPKIKLGAGVSFELFTAPDSLESRIFRDHLIDGVLCIPVYERDEGDDEIDGTQEEKTKPPSREAMIEYIKQAIGEGYQPKNCDELISNPDLLWQLHDEAVDYEYRACWRWYQEGHGFHETFSVPEKIHDHSCVNCFSDKGPCLGECHVSDVNKARSSSFEDVVKPVIKWLNENANPHTSVIIDATSAHLLTGEISIHMEEFIKD
ncbi:hypothetical protein LGR97_20015 [Klebsiella quasipneumoniae subsp. similipneumoniae]|uniref:hypothetical protein n=1 Tax=Klebsiella quasipneumoniae TaxID=1463165 RepID=UPI001F338560|nr:hypothetical protein [Klebsiella quasipneumoniae]MCF2311826.1 hypothetical protein [Klebsiella quasipneumoniae subsp. similipneumoniae]HBT6278857.1 hypothetical protein [Klebsiella quasipneumoniae]HCQ8110441.1 hypothetical protein [Klebsiella quasipneumoniae subsp. similipneumoniae]HDE1085516.1 hypothetical protein [Klebsiella quasipneumoniae]HDE1501270.1 hypothetical protein [Klebsiella quasipneumoniae]